MIHVYECFVQQFVFSCTMWFDLGRSEGFPTQYPPRPTPVTVDVLEAGIITAFLLLATSFLVALPSTVFSKNVNLFIRVSVTLLIGLFILLGNFGQEWEVSYVVAKTPYRAGIPEEIDAFVGLKIGLRSVNVTLKNTTALGEELRNEVIDYNERFEWTWDQGRFGFGPFAGHLQREFRASQYRGIPIPILWVVEYFIIDGEGFRFGRFYRTAGWYCHIALWTAFVSWILAIILFRSVIRYGAYWLCICGLLQLTAILLWAVIRNPLPLKIPFEGGTMVTKYGVSFWLTVISGVTSCLISIIIIIMDSKFESKVHYFFDMDPFTNYEVAYLTKEEEAVRRHRPSSKTNDVPLIDMRNINPHTVEEDDVEYMPVYVRRTMAPPKVIRTNKPKNLVYP